MYLWCIVLKVCIVQAAACTDRSLSYWILQLRNQRELKCASKQRHRPQYTVPVLEVHSHLKALQILHYADMMFHHPNWTKTPAVEYHPTKHARRTNTSTITSTMYSKHWSLYCIARSPVIIAITNTEYIASSPSAKAPLRRIPAGIAILQLMCSVFTKSILHFTIIPSPLQSLVGSYGSISPYLKVSCTSGQSAKGYIPNKHARPQAR